MKKKNWHLDKYAVAYLKDDEEHWAQTEFNLSEARRCRDILNEHDVRCGRAPMYYVSAIDDTTL